MNKWSVRVAGVIMLLFFLLMFAYLKKQLEQLQQDRGVTTTAPATTT